MLALGQIEGAQVVLREIRDCFAEAGLEPGARVETLQRKLIALQPELCVENQGPLGEVFGRARELLEIERALTDDRQLVLIEGDAGIGKSHLLKHAIRAAGQSGLNVADARCIDLAEPGAVIVDLVRQTIPSMSSADPREALALLEAVVSGGSDWLIVVEDIHELDYLSTKLLRRLLLGRRNDQTRAMFTMRPGPWAPFVREFVFDLLETEAVAHHRIGPLSVEAVDEWLAATTKLSPAQRWTASQRAHSLSGGFPVVLDLMLALPERILEVPTGTSTVERLLPYVVNASITDLCENALLSIAALVGPTFDVSVVAQIAGVSVAAVLDVVKVAESQRICRRIDEFTFGFQHELFREAVLWETSTTWRCQTQNQVAAVLESRGGDIGAVGLLRANALLGSSSKEDFDVVLGAARELVSARRWDAALSVLEAFGIAASSQQWLLAAHHIAESQMLLGVARDGCSDWVGARNAFRASWMHAGELPDLQVEIALRSAGGSQPFDGDEERLNWICQAEAVAPTKHSKTRLAAERLFLNGMASLTQEVRQEANEMWSDQLAIRASVLDGNSEEDIESMCTYDAVLHGMTVALIADFEPENRIRAAVQRRQLHEVENPEYLLSPIIVEMTSQLEVGKAARFSALLAELGEVVDVLQRPGDRWDQLLAQTSHHEWFGNTAQADAVSLDAFKLAERFDVVGGPSAFAAHIVGRLLRTGDGAKFREFGINDFEINRPLDNSKPGADRPALSRAFEAMAASLVGDVEAVEVARLANLLSSQPPFLGWTCAVSMLSVVIALSDQSDPYVVHAAEELFAASQPYAGRMVTVGTVPAGLFGPIDGFRALLARSAGDGWVADALEKQAALFVEKSELHVIPVAEVVSTLRWPQAGQ